MSFRSNAGRSLRVSLSLGALTLLLGSACPETQVGPLPVARVKVSLDSIGIVVGETAGLKVIALDSTSALVVGTTATWTTSGAAIATVNDTGLVQGMGPGIATITATVGTKSGTAKVVVTPRPAIAIGSASVSFSATSGGPSPGPQTAAITNGGGATLTGLAVRTVTF